MALSRQGLLSFKKLLRKIQSPGCLLGPGQFFHSQAIYHRALLVRSWPKQSRWQWGLLLGAGLIYWYGYGLWRALGRYGYIVLYQCPEIGISPSRQLMALSYLGLWLGVYPRDYYRLRLYRYPYHHWHHFVFSQEQQTWHAVHFYNVATPGVTLLQDKLAFEQQGREQGLLIVQTTQVYRAGKTIDVDVLFKCRSIFLKPNMAHASRGCLKLIWQADSNSYRLLGKTLLGKPIDESQITAIRKHLKAALADADYLQQAVLVNSEEMARFCQCSELAIVRLTTAWLEGKAVCVYRQLELILIKEKHPLRIYPLDESGRVLMPDRRTIDEDEPLIVCGKEIALPHWQSLCMLAQNAHRLVSDVAMVAWDIAVCPQGPVLIEGNSGWGLVQPQRTNQLPLLETPIFSKALR